MYVYGETLQKNEVFLTKKALVMTHFVISSITMYNM